MTGFRICHLLAARKFGRPIELIPHLAMEPFQNKITHEKMSLYYLLIS